MIEINTASYYRIGIDIIEIKIRLYITLEAVGARGF